MTDAILLMLLSLLYDKQISSYSRNWDAALVGEQARKFDFIKRADGGRITTVKDLES